MIFVKQGAKVDTNVYIDDILAPALHDMKELFKNEDFTIQQDGAHSHTSNKTQAWCKDNVVLEQGIVASFITRTQQNEL